MKRIVYLTAALVLALGIGGAAGQGAAAERFQGVVKAITGSSITVERGTLSGVFTVDSKTHIAAKGASTATKKNKDAGKPGLTVADAVHVGDQVIVMFHDMKGSMMATDIRVSAQGSGK